MDKKIDKLDVKTTILLSFGFFGSSLVWQIYNVNVPLILNDMALSAVMIGIIMSIDNFFGVIFQPLFGKLSDKTRTRFGRRLPYLFICMPVSAALFVFIPFMNTLSSLMILVIGFTFVMSIWRTPAVSLMPDLTPGKFQSQANGIVNLMGGVGAVIALAGGGLLYNIGGFPLPFAVGGAFLVFAMFILMGFVREPKEATEIKNTETKEEKAPPMDKIEFKSLLLILSAIFFWFMGYDAVSTFFSLYATNILGVSAGDASMMLSLFAGMLVLFAVPAGILGAKFGRRRLIMTGLLGISLLFLPLTFIDNVVLTGVMLFLGGIFWACININSLPMITKIAGPLRIGAFIGYYYFFSFSSQLITAPIYGFINDFVDNWRSLFVYACVNFVIALFLMLFVKRGEENSPNVN